MQSLCTPVCQALRILCKPEIAIALVMLGLNITIIFSHNRKFIEYASNLLAEFWRFDSSRGGTQAPRYGIGDQSSDCSQWTNHSSANHTRWHVPGLHRCVTPCTTKFTREGYYLLGVCPVFRCDRKGEGNSWACVVGCDPKRGADNAENCLWTVEAEVHFTPELSTYL